MPPRFCPCVLLLLMAQALVAEQLPEDLATVPESGRTELAERWREQPSRYERRQLVQQLLAPALATRCAALDLLESLSGRDFGLDPWLPPSEVSASTRQALDDWARSDSAFLDSAAEPTEARLREAVALLASADDETRERTLRLFLPHAQKLIAVIVRTLAAEPNLGDKETRNLRYAEYRLQLEDALRGKAGTVARQLVSSRRGEVIEGLEALRKAAPSILPVAFSLFEHPDPLVRETAVDVMLTCSPATALPVLLPLLEKEEDPNILQIAFRRSVDTPLPALKQLLIRHAGSENEDLAVAALNTLRDLKRPSIVVSSPEQKNGGVRLPADRIAALLASPHWRIRSSCLELLASSNSSDVLPPVEDELLELLYASLKDPDPTVRRQAFAAIAKGKYFHPSLAAYCKELVADDPDMLARALYLLMARNADIDESLRQMIARMTVEQLENIVAMEEELSSYLSDKGKVNRATRAVLAAIEKNPDKAVQRLYLQIRAKHIVSTTAGWERLLGFFSDPSISRAHKAELLRKLPVDEIFKRIDSSLLPVTPAERELQRGKGKIRRSATTRRFAPSLERFLSLLRGWRDGTETTGDELADAALICLASLGEAESTVRLRQRYAALELPEKLRLFDDARESYLPKELLLCGLRDESKKVRDESLYALLRRHDIALSAEMISPAAAPDEVWDEILDSWARNCLYSSDKKERSQLRPLLLAAVADPAVPAARRDMTAFYCCLDETTRKKAAVQDYIAACQSPFAEYLRFVNDAPKRPVDVPAWAERWKSSRLPLIRRSVASCFLDVDEWYFYYPRGDGSINRTRATILYRKIWAGNNRTLKKPGRVLDIVRALERDPDPAVSAMASLSLLRLTGSCDTASLLDRLARFDAAAKKDTGEKQTDLSEKRVLAATLQMQLQNCVSNMAHEASSHGDFAYGVVFASQKPNRGKKLTSDEKTVVQGVRNLFGGEMEMSSKVLDQLGDSEQGSRRIVRFADMANRVLAAPDAGPKAPETASKETPRDDGAIAAATLVFFEKPGCDECDRVARELERLQREYPALNVETFTITSPEGLEKNAVLCRRFDVPSRDRSIAPAVFSSRGYLARKRLDEPALRRLAAEEIFHAEHMAKPPASLETTPDEAARARQDIADAYAGMTLGIVLLGGLIDGVNPCAFATLVFFLSYLRLVRRSRRETLLTGAVFIAAVYLTYFAIGLMFNEMIGVLRSLHTWKTALDLLFAALAALAAVLSFRDALLARRGRQRDMSLKLPAFLQNRIRAVTRRQVRARSIVLSACISGILISALELACTGQVYAPIIYQIRLGSSSAVGMLALYNLAFIAPLIVIFWMGSRNGGDKLAAFQQRHAALVKSLLGLLFLALAVLIASQVWN